MKTKLLPNTCKLLAALSISAVGVLTFSFPATAAVLWDEDTQGDLSNDRLAPTQLGSLMPGDNFVSMVADNPETHPNPSVFFSFYRDLDYFSVIVPEGLQLNKLILSQYGGGTSDDVAFIAIQRGTQFTEPPLPASIYNTAGGGSTNPANLLGYALPGNKTTYSVNSNCSSVNLSGTPLPPGAVVQEGEDLLPIMGDGSNNRSDRIQPNTCFIFAPPRGFSTPLPAGGYVFWAQQTVPGDTRSTLNFVTTRIPEQTSALALLVLGAVGLGLWKKEVLY